MTQLRVRYAILGSLAVLLAAVPARGQSGFMFWSPTATVSLMGGWVSPGEGGDLLAFTRDELTIEEGDFAAPLVQAEVAMRASERVDLAVGLEYASQTVDSEMREWVTADDRPIPQSTRFSRTRLLGSVKGYLFPRGQQVGRYAWVPNRWSPYIGGGVGMSWYQFVQDGDFVDYETLDIFGDRFAASGNDWTVHGLVGAQVNVGTRVLLRGEYRYIRGDAGVEGDDFVGFQEVDLSGSSFLLGVAVRL